MTLDRPDTSYPKKPRMSPYVLVPRHLVPASAKDAATRAGVGPCPQRLYGLGDSRPGSRSGTVERPLGGPEPG